MKHLIGLYLVELEWTIAPAWLAVCALLGFLAAAHLYMKKAGFPEIKQSQLLLMAALRWISVTLIAALFMAPILKLLQTKTEPRQLVFLQDRSASISTAADSTDLKSFVTEAQAVMNAFETTVEPKYLSFDNRVYFSDSSGFDGKSTNISHAIQQVKEQYASDRLAGIILATDGIYNEGQNPFYLSGLERIPIHTVALGDTTAGKDIEIQRVFHNRVVYKGDQFRIEIDVAASDLANENSSISVRRIAPSTLPQSPRENFRIGDKEYFKTFTFTLTADQAGVNQYRVQIPKTGDEEVVRNNYFDFFVDVIESRQKILLLAHAPHPDLNAYKTSLEGLKNYEVTIKYASNKVNQLNDYDLVVLHDLPSGKHQINDVLNRLNQLKKPRLFVVGSRTDVRALNRAQNALKIQAQPNQFTDAEPAYVSGFNLFAVNDEVSRLSRQFPPLRVPFGSYAPGGGFDVLFKQEIKNVETNYPMVVLGEEKGIKTGVIAGDGMWKWRMFDFIQNKSFERSDELFSKIFQYLAVVSDKRRFRINHDKRIYNENDRVYLTGEFYNASYELKNEADVELTLINSEGERSNYAFSKSDRAYVLDLGLLSPDNYSYEARLLESGQEYKSSGRFTVKPLLVEMQQTRADHQLLRNISATSGGNFYLPNQLQQLKDDLISSNTTKPLYISSYDRMSVLNITWILVVLLLTLSTEWFLRKYLGGY